MFCLRRSVRLRNGIELETPVLVPAFSSCAVGPIPFDKDHSGKPKLTTCSIVHSDWLTASVDKVLLISAYDICHNLLADSETLTSGYAQSRYSGPKLLMIDNGCYEKSGGPAGSPFSAAFRPSRSKGGSLPWKESRYRATVDSLDKDIRAAIVSWDHEATYEEQVARAQSFLGTRERFAATILLKRPKGARFHRLETLSGETASNLRAFDIVGITEKELGDTIIERLTTLARLRKRLDDADVLAPIHVFGGLDPFFTPLYFAAGGEIFDGLGWLRYSYKDGMTVSRDAGVLLGGHYEKRWESAMNKVLLDNLDALDELSRELRVFAHKNGSWPELRKGAALQPIWELVEERQGRGHGR